MLKTVKTLVRNLNEENETLKKEIKELKQRLQYRHTEINDLRYTKKQLTKLLDEVSQQKYNHS